MDVVFKAKAFAKGVYAVRGLACGKSGAVYFEHPEAVARHVWQATLDDAATAAALLHDVLDDARISADLLVEEFGYAVTALVLEVAQTSTVRDGSRNDRQSAERAHAARASPIGQTIKLADLIDSTATAIARNLSNPSAELDCLKGYLEALPRADGGLRREAWTLVHKPQAEIHA